MQIAVVLDPLVMYKISGKVSERLEEGFKKTNETFANVMARLATIDEAGFVGLSREQLAVVATRAYSPDPVRREEEVKRDLLAARIDPAPA